MSNRQVSRINQALHLRELDELNRAESEEEEAPVRSKPTFAFHEESSESEGDADVSDNEIVFPKAVPAPVIDGTKVVEDQDDMAFLEKEIAKNEGCTLQSVDFKHIIVPVYFITDPKDLDLDKVLNDKFSRNNFMRQVELQEGGGAGAAKKRVDKGTSKGVMRKNLLASHRNYLFGAPKEDWTKPPSFIGGGMQMIRTVDANQPHISHFTVQWSPEYQRVNELYQLIQNTGDVNRLVMFLANHPYHVEGLLQLSMVFARLGLMDRSSDLVRRCLYCYECTFPESFKPHSGLCRMNPNTKENRFFFQALFKHLQHCFTLGCHPLTVDLCRLMLALDPSDRSHHLLLTLDYYLLQAGSYDLLQSFTNGAGDSTSTTSADSGNVIELTDFTEYQWPSPYRIDESTPLEDTARATTTAASTIADLPNWWYSLALSHYLSELDSQRKQSYLVSNSSSSSSSDSSSQTKSGQTFLVPNSSSRHAVSSFMLKCALYRFPHLLSQLLNKAGVTVGLFANATWKPILNHGYFSGAMNMVPSSSYLRNVSHIYSHRVGALWNTPEIHAWILEAAKQVLVRVDSPKDSSPTAAGANSMEDHYRRLSNAPALSQYATARLEDFTEEVTRMPNELNNLIDPQLMDPRVLAGGIRFNNEQLGVELPRNRPRMNRFEREQLEQRRREEQSYILDLTMPLMELFFASLVPWYRLPGTLR